jgi:geranylgeranyl pyrophosphate synthase
MDNFINHIKADETLSNSSKEKLETIETLLEEMNSSFPNYFTEYHLEDDFVMNHVSRHYIKYSGKHLRPLLLMAIFVILYPEYNAKHLVKLAMSCEVLHISTLYHDDVMDRALYRRYVPSANSLYGNKLAILGGDLLLSHYYSLMLELNNIEMCGSFNRAFKRTITGQMEELLYNKNFKESLSSAAYFKIIKNKTAAIFRSIFAAVSYFCEDMKKHEQLLDEIGLNFGIAFQILDDMLDISSTTKKLGKDTQNDLEQSVLTLPIVYATESGEVELTALEDDKGHDLFYSKILHSQAFQRSYLDFLGYKRSVIELSKSIGKPELSEVLVATLALMERRLKLTM